MCVYAWRNLDAGAGLHGWCQTGYPSGGIVRAPHRAQLHCIGWADGPIGTREVSNHQFGNVFCSHTQRQVRISQHAWFTWGQRMGSGPRILVMCWNSYFWGIWCVCMYIGNEAEGGGQTDKETKWTTWWSVRNGLQNGWYSLQVFQSLFSFPLPPALPQRLPLSVVAE